MLSVCVIDPEGIAPQEGKSATATVSMGPKAPLDSHAAVILGHGGEDSSAIETLWSPRANEGANERANEGANEGANEAAGLNFLTRLDS